MAAVAGLSIPVAKIFAKADAATAAKPHAIRLNTPWRRCIANGSGRMHVRMRPVAVAAAPDKLSEKVEESIKAAQEVCSEDPVSGECAASWDEVEELSAAASHARDRQKESDPLENYCKDNPEVDECRTYD